VDSYSNGGKTGLILDLKAKGFSVRRSTKAVNAFFECMRQALARGETVEVPGGWLRTQIQEGKPHKQYVQKRRNVNTGKLF
jgi:nucleoid DNA-binding protein